MADASEAAFPRKCTGERWGNRRSGSPAAVMPPHVRFDGGDPPRGRNGRGSITHKRVRGKAGQFVQKASLLSFRRKREAEGFSLSRGKEKRILEREKPAHIRPTPSSTNSLSFPCSLSTGFFFHHTVKVKSGFRGRDVRRGKSGIVATTAAVCTNTTRGCKGLGRSEKENSPFLEAKEKIRIDFQWDFFTCQRKK